jgi:Protein of unknown function (DUF2726)
MTLLLIILFIFFAIVIFAAITKQQSGNTDGFPYQKCKSLFSPAERSFLGVLEQAVGSEHRVFGKVRIADVASVKNLSNRSTWQRAFNRISAKHFDFVICKASDLTVVCAVELDDKSHQQSKRKERDNFASGVCQAISLPLLQVPAQQAYSLQELKSKVSLAINPPLTTVVT